jgi:hypothetical protein
MRKAELQELALQIGASPEGLKAEILSSIERMRPPSDIKAPGQPSHTPKLPHRPDYNEESASSGSVDCRITLNRAECYTVHAGSQPGSGLHTAPSSPNAYSATSILVEGRGGRDRRRGEEPLIIRNSAAVGKCGSQHDECASEALSGSSETLSGGDALSAQESRRTVVRPVDEEVNRPHQITAHKTQVKQERCGGSDAMLDLLEELSDEDSPESARPLHSTVRVLSRSLD